VSTPLLEIAGLRKAFGGNVVIPGLDLALPGGAATALIGPNGAGKTTIFNLVTGFLTPDAGTVRYRGERISGHRPEVVFDRGIARTFQELRLFAGMTVLDNVLVGRERRRGSWRRTRGNVEKAREALATFGLDDQRDVLARDLSYAEQKFLSLARVLGTDAELLLLDEPTSGLDGPSLELVMELIPQFGGQGRTVLIIEHNLDVVRAIAEQVVFLESGKAIAAGRCEELFARQDLADIYFGNVSA
jgi:branched-chain amino acid transport system ATP-binding protein